MSMAIFSSGEFFSISCAMVWACSTILFRKGGEHVPPLALNCFKDVVALVLFIATLPFLGVSLFEPHSHVQWVTLLLSGALGIGVADTMFFAALNRIGAGKLAIVSSLYCPLVVLFAWMYLHDPLRVTVIVGALLMVCAIIVGTASRDGPGGTSKAGTLAQGIVLGFISVAIMAFAIVLAKPVLDQVNPWWAATVRLIGGTVLVGVQALLTRERAATIACFKPSRVWRFTLTGSVAGAYIAMILWVIGFSRTSAGIAGVLNETTVIFAPVLGAVFLGEAFTARKAVAIVLALCGAGFVVWR
jgi:drug/metabolite transporter (DMT)-like permease